MARIVPIPPHREGFACDWRISSPSAPKLMTGYGGLDEHLKYLAELKAATMVACEYCIDLGSQAVRRCGMADEKIRALPRYRGSDLFDDTERLVLDYAVGMTRTPADV